MVYENVHYRLSRFWGPEEKPEIYRKIISMDRAVTFKEFTELKDWMISHFATKEDVLPRLGRLEQDVAVLKQDVTVLKYDVGILKEDLAAFKQEMREFKNETITRFDKIFGMLETLNQERLFMHDALVRIEEKLAK